MKYTLLLFQLIVLLLVISPCICAQDGKLDSIKMQVDQHSSRDSIRVSLLIDLTKYYTTRDFSQSRPAIDEALSISREIQYIRGEGYSLNALSTYYTLAGQLDSALIHALNAEKILLALDDQQNLLVTYSTLARIYASQLKFEKALEIQLKNVEIVKDMPASANKASYYFYVAKTYQGLEQFEMAANNYQEALDISQACHFATGVAIAQGSLGVIANQLGDHKLAIEYSFKSLAFFKKQNQKTNMAASYITLGELYESLNSYDSAININAKAIRILEGTSNFNILKDAYRLQTKYYELSKKYDSANIYLKLHYAMKDTLSSASKTKVIEDLQTKYETKKKEAEIATLSQQAVIRTLELRQKNQGIIIGLSIFTMLLFGGFLFYRQRLSNREKIQIEVEQRFLRSQLNPHFIFNALLAIQNFMLKNSAESAAIYLSKFAKLMREILENSRQEFIPVEDEISMISNYMDIHKMRLNNVFDYKIEIADDIEPETDTIPPMFVQPFIENAIEHGMASKKADGLISLKLEKHGDYISIEINDNGGGITHKPTTSDEHTSLATTIIQERMELFNRSLKTKIELVLQNVHNGTDEIQGTRVELKVPFSYI